MKDGKVTIKPGTAIESQTQAVNFWKAQPDLPYFKSAMSTDINKIEKVIELKKELKKLKTKGEKFQSVTTDEDQIKVIEIKKDITQTCAKILKQTEQGKKLLKAIHQYSCDIEKELIGKYTGEGGEIDRLGKISQTYATAKATALRKKNDEAIAKAERDVEKKRERIAARAEKWEEKGNSQKAEQLKQVAKEVEVEPDIEYEDPKNWIFESFVLKKRVFLKELIEDPFSDLSGVILQKTLLNAKAKAVMSERPQLFKKTDWGYVEGKKKK